MSTPTWRTRDGRLLVIADMDSDHIKNAIRILRRRYRASCWLYAMAADAYSEDAPDGASAMMAAEAEARALMAEADKQESIESEVRSFADLSAELARRNLKEMPWQ